MRTGDSPILPVIFRPALPVAGRRHARERRLADRLEKYMTKNGFRVRIGHPKTLSEAVEMAREAGRSSPLVVAAGGDGTINAVATGIMDTGCCLGILPLGSGNDLARGLHIPKNLSGAVRLLRSGYELLTGGPETGKVRSGTILRNMDTGRIASMESPEPDPVLPSTPHRFLNTLGIGFDGEVAWNASQMRMNGGMMKYMRGVIRSLFTYQATGMTVTADGETISGRFLMATVANGPFEGSGIPVAPDADPTDGFFNLILIRDADTLSRLLLFIRVLFSGTSEGGLILIRKCRNVHISTSLPVMVHADGEMISARMNGLSAVIQPASLTVIGGQPTRMRM
ncbi:MAG: diacylglycerol kinase family protein [Cyclonatronaceae bacterium]